MAFRTCWHIDTTRTLAGLLGSALKPAEVRNGEAAEMPLGQQLATLVVVQFLHVRLGHVRTSSAADTAQSVEVARRRGLGQWPSPFGLLGPRPQR